MENIERLRALRIFEVAPIQDRIREEASCYRDLTAIGWVCFEDLEERAEEIAVAEERIATLADLAEKAVADTRDPGFGAAPNSLQALRDLHIVEVGDFILDLPESYSCYGMCNPSNQARTAQLERIAADAVETFR